MFVLAKAKAKPSSFLKKQGGVYAHKKQKTFNRGKSILIGFKGNHVWGSTPSAYPPLYVFSLALFLF
jgi:hypothetical protein